MQDNLCDPYKKWTAYMKPKFPYSKLSAASSPLQFNQLLELVKSFLCLSISTVMSTGVKKICTMTATSNFCTKTEAVFRITEQKLILPPRGMTCKISSEIASDCSLSSLSIKHSHSLSSTCEQLLITMEARTAL